MQNEVESKMSEEPESHEDRVLNAVHAILVRDGRIKPTVECSECGAPIRKVGTWAETGADTFAHVSPKTTKTCPANVAGRHLAPSK